MRKMSNQRKGEITRTAARALVVAVERLFTEEELRRLRVLHHPRCPAIVAGEIRSCSCRPSLVIAKV